MSLNKRTVYLIKHGTGTLSGANGQHSFNTYEEALEEATTFKENPRSHNSTMSDSSVKYWKAQDLRVERQYTETEILIEI